MSLAQTLADGSATRQDSVSLPSIPYPQRPPQCVPQASLGIWGPCRSHFLTSASGCKFLGGRNGTAVTVKDRGLLQPLPCCFVTPICW